MVRLGLLITAVAGVLVATGAPSAGTVAQCIGDCDNSGAVTVDELVKGAHIALGSLPLGECPQFDCNNTGHMPLECLIVAVNNALGECAVPLATATPTPTATPTRTGTPPTPVPTCFFPTIPPPSVSFHVQPEAPMVGDVVQVSVLFNMFTGPPYVSSISGAGPIFDQPRLIHSGGTFGYWTNTFEMRALQPGTATLVLFFDYEVTFEICDPLNPYYEIAHDSASVDINVGASASPTLTGPPGPTPTLPPCDPGLLHVAPVTSPTDQLVQTIHVTSLVPGSSVTVSVRSASGLEYVTYGDAELPMEIDLPFALLAGQTTQLDACFQSTACQGFVCASNDTNGNPLQIEQVIPTPRPALQTVTPTPSATRTPTSPQPPNTPTATAADCGAPQPVVGAVVSPTSELTQVITGYVQIGGPYDYVTACSPAGCATMQLRGTTIMLYHPFAVEIPLIPGTQNPVEVCTYDTCGGSACVRAAVNGEPLIIEQASAAQ